MRAFGSFWTGVIPTEDIGNLNEDMGPLLFSLECSVRVPRMISDRSGAVSS